MTITLLKQLGFNDSLARAYLALLEHAHLTPPELAKLTNETRPNAYSLLSKLVDLGLAKKDTSVKKATYVPENPVALEKLMQKQRQEAIERERMAQDNLPELMNMYNLTSERPGVRFYEGKKGIESIFKEQLRENKPITFVRTLADIDFFGFPYMRDLRNLAPKAGIPRRTITPDNPLAPIDHVASDKRKLITRTWMHLNDYTAPVEWTVFGDKVSIISFGKEAMGLVIDSPQIAEGLRQLLGLLDEGLRRRPDYADLPRLAQYTSFDDYTKKHPKLAKTPRR